MRIEYVGLHSCQATARRGCGDNGLSGIRIEQDLGMLLRTPGLPCGCWVLGERGKEREMQLATESDGARVCSCLGTREKL